MNAVYIVITVIAALFFVGSGVLLPLFELAEQLPGRRKVRGPTPQSSPTTPATRDEHDARRNDGLRYESDSRNGARNDDDTRCNDENRYDGESRRGDGERIAA